MGIVVAFSQPAASILFSSSCSRCAALALPIASVIALIAVMTGPLSITVALNKFHSVLRRFTAPCAPCAACSAAGPNSSFRTAASLGSISSAVTCPFLSISSSCAVVTPIALAARLKAPGRRSPNCPRSSSACTFPLLIICPSARNTPSICSVLKDKAAPAWDTPSKMPFRSFWSALPFPAAKNPLAASAVDWNSSPSLLLIS